MNVDKDITHVWEQSASGCLYMLDWKEWICLVCGAAKIIYEDVENSYDNYEDSIDFRFIYGNNAEEIDLKQDEIMSCNEVILYNLIK